MKDKPGLQIIGTENQGQSFINIFTNGLIDLNPSDLEQLAEGLGKRYPRFGGWLAITQERGITLRIIGPKFMGGEFRR